MILIGDMQSPSLLLEKPNKSGTSSLHKAFKNAVSELVKGYNVIVKDSATKLRKYMNSDNVDYDGDDYDKLHVFGKRISRSFSTHFKGLPHIIKDSLLDYDFFDNFDTIMKVGGESLSYAIEGLISDISDDYSGVKIAKDLPNITKMIKKGTSPFLKDVKSVLIEFNKKLDDYVSGHLERKKKAAELVAGFKNKHQHLIQKLVKSLMTISTSFVEALEDDYDRRDKLTGKLSKKLNVSSNMISRVLRCCFYDHDESYKERCKRIENLCDDATLYDKHQLVDLSTVFSSADIIVATISQLQKDFEKSSVITPDNAEAPKTAPMGQIAFGMNRKDRVPREPDTSQEKSLYTDLDDHFDSNEKLSVKSAALLQSFLKKGYYEPIIHEPSQGVVYRGIGVNTEWLQKFLKIGKHVPPKKGIADVSLVLNPKSGASSSWSKSREIAYGFANGEGRSWSIVLYADVQNNKNKFVMGPGGLYRVNGLDNHESEQEIVGLGKISVFRIEWKNHGSYNDDDDDDDYYH